MLALVTSWTDLKRFHYYYPNYNVYLVKNKVKPMLKDFSDFKEFLSIYPFEISDIEIKKLALSKVKEINDLTKYFNIMKDTSSTINQLPKYLNSRSDVVFALKNFPFYPDKKLLEDKLLEKSTTISQLSEASKLIPNRYNDIENKAFNLVSDLDDVAQFLKYFPNSSLTSKLEEKAFNLVSSLDDVADFLKYFPNSGFSSKLEDKAFSFVTDISSAKEFQKLFPNSSHKSELEAKIKSYADNLIAKAQQAYYSGDYYSTYDYANTAYDYAITKTQKDKAYNLYSSSCTHLCSYELRLFDKWDEYNSTYNYHSWYYTYNLTIKNKCDETDFFHLYIIYNKHYDRGGWIDAKIYVYKSDIKDNDYYYYANSTSETISGSGRCSRSGYIYKRYSYNMTNFLSIDDIADYCAADFVERHRRYILRCK